MDRPVWSGLLRYHSHMSAFVSCSITRSSTSPMSRGAWSCRRSRRGSYTCRGRGRSADHDGRSSCRQPAGRSGTGRAVMRVLGSSPTEFPGHALLAMLSIGAAVFFVSARMTRQPKRAATRSDRGRTLVDEQQRTQFDNIARTARLIARPAEVKSAIDTQHPPTLRRSRRTWERRRRPADRIGPHGETLARAATTRDHRTNPDLKPPWMASCRRLLAAPPRRARNRQRPRLRRHESPDVLGVLSIGYLPNDCGRHIQALTGADIAFAMDGAVRASTLGPGAASALATVLTTPPTRLVIDAWNTSPRRNLGTKTARRTRGITCARAASACARSAASRRPSARSAYSPPCWVVVSYAVRGPSRAARDHHGSHVSGGDHTASDAKICHQAARRLGR